MRQEPFFVFSSTVVESFAVLNDSFPVVISDFGIFDDSLTISEFWKRQQWIYVFFETARSAFRAFEPTELVFISVNREPLNFMVCHYYPPLTSHKLRPFTELDESDTEELDCSQSQTGLCPKQEDICEEENNRNLPYRYDIFGDSRCLHNSTCVTDLNGKNKFSCHCRPNFSGTWCETNECQPEYLEKTGMSRNAIIRHQLLKPDGKNVMAFWDEGGQYQHFYPKIEQGILWCQINDDCAGLVRTQYWGEDSDRWPWIAVSNIEEDRESYESQEHRIVFSKC